MCQLGLKCRLTGIAKLRQHGWRDQGRGALTWHLVASESESDGLWPLLMLTQPLLGLTVQQSEISRQVGCSAGEWPRPPPPS